MTKNASEFEPTPVILLAKQPREKKSEHEVAEDLQAALASVKETEIPVMSRDRSIPRKEQAALARKLFKGLGLKGISVTTPNYSMAQSVRVELPELQIHCEDMYPHGGEHKYGCILPADSEHRCLTCKANSAMSAKVEEILARAFPQHDDRSDTMTDYFDYCWSFR